MTTYTDTFTGSGSAVVGSTPDGGLGPVWLGFDGVALYNYENPLELTGAATTGNPISRSGYAELDSENASATCGVVSAVEFSGTFAGYADIELRNAASDIGQYWTFAYDSTPHEIADWPGYYADGIWLGAYCNSIRSSAHSVELMFQGAIAVLPAVEDPPEGEEGPPGHPEYSVIEPDITVTLGVTNTTQNAELQHPSPWWDGSQGISYSWGAGSTLPTGGGVGAVAAFVPLATAARITGTITVREPHFVNDGGSEYWTTAEGTFSLPSQGWGLPFLFRIVVARAEDGTVSVFTEPLGGGAQTPITVAWYSEYADFASGWLGGEVASAQSALPRSASYNLVGLQATAGTGGTVFPSGSPALSTDPNSHLYVRKIAISDSSVPTIALDPTSLSFTAPEGFADPSDQTVDVTNSGGGTLDGLTVSVVGDEEISAFLDGTTAPTTVTVQCLTPLAAGVYTATVSVASTAVGVTNSPQDITVTFTVTPGYVDRTFTLTAYRYNADWANRFTAGWDSGLDPAHEQNSGEEYTSTAGLNIAANFSVNHVHKVAAGGGTFTATVEYGAWANPSRFAGSYTFDPVVWPNFAFADIVLTVRTWNADQRAEVISGTITVGPGWTWVHGNGGALGEEPPMRPYWWYPPNGGGDGRPYPWYPPNGERHPVIVIPRPGILPPVLGWTEPITAWIPATAQVPFDVVIGADGEPEAVFPHVTEVANWRRAGELTDLDADLVGQGLALIAGGGVVWRYAEQATAKLRVEVETDATTWTAPAAARTPTWD